MNHYEGITPDQRYKNDVLNELRKISAALEKQNDSKTTKTIPKRT